MKNKHPSQQQTHESATPVRTIAPTPPTEGETDFHSSPDEVARKAYFAYINHGSLPGHDVQHWLKAEAQLIDERNRTRTHGSHNLT